MAARTRPAAISTGIALTRTHDHVGVLRALRVLLDGEEVGRLTCGERRVLAVDAGRHCVQVAMDWCVSEPRVVVIRAGAVVELECGGRHRGAWLGVGLVACFVAPHRVFYVGPLTDRADAPPERSEVILGLMVACGTVQAVLGVVWLVLWAFFG